MKAFNVCALGLSCACWIGFSLAGDELATGRIVPVSWPADYEGAAAPVPDPRLSAMNKVFLPVLIPDSFFKFKSFQLVAQPLHYTASASNEDLTMSISGTRVAVDPPKGSDKRQTPAADVMTEISEGSAFATTIKSGAAYLATVECKEPTDKRCATVDYVQALLKSAAFIGGSKAQPDALQSGAAAPLPPATPFDSNFTFRPPGELIPHSGRGVTSAVIYAPGIRFPIEQPPAYLNSQVWGIGGSSGPKGSWRDKGNYKYPWRDNFCESRSFKTPACPAAQGHQGVDIRPVDAKDNQYWVVAAEDGVISDIGKYTVTLQAQQSRYRYLHMKMSSLAVKQGQTVTRGQHLGRVSNEFGGTPTPVHLHFEIMQNLSGEGFLHVPPYMSLVRAYQQGN